MSDEIRRIRNMWISVLTTGLDEYRRRVQGAAAGKRSISLDGHSFGLRSVESETHLAREWVTGDARQIADLAGITWHEDKAMRHIAHGTKDPRKDAA